MTSFLLDCNAGGALDDEMDGIEDGPIIEDAVAGLIADATDQGDRLACEFYAEWTEYVSGQPERVSRTWPKGTPLLTTLRTPSLLVGVLDGVLVHLTGGMWEGKDA